MIFWSKSCWDMKFQWQISVNYKKKLGLWVGSFFSLCTRGPIPLGPRVQSGVTNDHHIWSLHKGNGSRLQQHTQQIDFMKANNEVSSFIVGTWCASIYLRISYRVSNKTQSCHLFNEMFWFACMYINWCNACRHIHFVRVLLCKQIIRTCQ